MIPLISLPKNVNLDIHGYQLIIRNHKVIEPEGFFTWIQSGGVLNNWVESVELMQRVGIKLDAAVEISAKEILENQKILQFIVWNNYEISDKYCTKEFLADSIGRQVAGLIASRIRRCKDWDEFRSVILSDSIFTKTMKNHLCGIKTMEKDSIHLPKSAMLLAADQILIISDARICLPKSLFGYMTNILEYSGDRWHNSVARMQEIGLYFMAVKETCMEELRNDHRVLGDYIWKICETADTLESCMEFSKGIQGRKMAEIFIKRITDCKDWDYFNGTMMPSSLFFHEMERKMSTGLEKMKCNTNTFEKNKIKGGIKL